MEPGSELGGAGLTEVLVRQSHKLAMQVPKILRLPWGAPKQALPYLDIRASTLGQKSKSGTKWCQSLPDESMLSALLHA